MTDEMVSYHCPVCGELNHANDEDVLVTCTNGHHLTVTSLADSEGFVEVEEIEESEDE